jgi:cytoskeletal protein CcmA (bactofilin family)
MSEWETLGSRRPAARVPAVQGNEPLRESAPAGVRNAVTLGPRDRLVGMLYIEGDLHLGGSVEGEVEATGDVDIGDEARVKASVAGGHVSIHGQVNGAVTARKRLVVGRTGSLIGDVRVARLVIQEGATFSGNVSMGAPSAALARPVEAVETPVVAQPAPVAEPEPQAAAPAAPVAPVESSKPAAQAPSAPRAAVTTKAPAGKAKVKGKDKPKRR